MMIVLATQKALSVLKEPMVINIADIVLPTINVQMPKVRFATTETVQYAMKLQTVLVKMQERFARIIVVQIAEKILNVRQGLTAFRTCALNVTQQIIRVIL